MRQKVLGPENPETAKSLDVLIDILKKEDKTAAAENLSRDSEGVTSRERRHANTDQQQLNPDR